MSTSDIAHDLLWSSAAVMDKMYGREGKYLEMPCSHERLISVVVAMMAAMETEGSSY